MPRLRLLLKALLKRTTETHADRPALEQALRTVRDTKNRQATPALLI